MDFIYFLGRFHVLALHLPIGMIIAALSLEWLTRGEKNQQLRVIAPYLWGLTAASATLTVVLGYMHVSEGGFTGPSIASHRLYGTLTAIVSVLVWFSSIYTKTLYQKSKALVAVVLIALVTLTGHYGGNLTHGSTYLVEYAPTPLRNLVGLEKRRPEITDLASADPYLDLVAPMFQARCSNCHNNDKQNGQFNIAEMDTLLAGGENGPVVIAGDASNSDLYRRISLPDDHEEFMPAESKTPLTAEQVEIIAWWINAGLPVNTNLSNVELNSSLTPTLKALITDELGLGTSNNNVAGNSSAKVSANSELINTLYQAGFLVRQLSETDAQLQVSLNSPNKPLSTEQLTVLGSATGTIAQLNLQGAEIDDQDLQLLAHLNLLTHLRLNNNQISNTGLGQLAQLAHLESLNIFGNPNISDEGVETLASISSLQQVFLWGTGISEAGIERLRQLRPDMDVLGSTSSAIDTSQNNASPFGF